MNNAGIIERPWLTTFYPALPACGPALHFPFLKYFAISTWKKFTNYRVAIEDEIKDKNVEITTVYWHLLDFSKNMGKWTPPINKK